MEKSNFTFYPGRVIIKIPAPEEALLLKILVFVMDKVGLSINFSESS